MIGKLNRRVTIKTLTSDQDAGGGLSAVDGVSYSMWAQVEDRNGFTVTGENQKVWNYDYKITVRYERSRIKKSNQIVEYDGKSLAIGSISFENEGNMKYAILRCSATDNNV